MNHKPLTEEHKQKMRDGRARKRAEKQAAAEAPMVVTEPIAGEVALTEDELALIRSKARAKIDSELAARRAAERDALLQQTLEAEIESQRLSAGLTDYRDEMVEFMVNVGPVSPGLVWNGVIYPHGTWLKKPRHVYDSMRDTMARSWESEDRSGNPNKKFAGERTLVGTQNPLLMETRMPDGSFTVGLYNPQVNGRSGHVAGARSRV